MRLDVARGFLAVDLRGMPPGGGKYPRSLPKGGERCGRITDLGSTLIIIGAINWGLVGLFNFDLVNAVFGGDSRSSPRASLSGVVYTLVALSGLYAFTFYRMGSEEETRQTEA